MNDLPDLHAPFAREAVTGASPKWAEAHTYRPDDDLVTAIEVAIDLGQPLLITGEPGCGKTSAAYWAAWRMGLSPDDLIVEQVRSEASASRMRYEFDAVAYFRESQASAVRGTEFIDDRRRYIRPGPLWRAFEATRTAGRRVVLLLDEIDKAPRDLPNDLLMEFDELRFEVPELPEKHADRFISARGNPGRLALTVFTSNAERQLPDAFLRRCLHHHIEFNNEHLEAVLTHRSDPERGDLKVPRSFIPVAVEALARLRGLGLRHTPGTAELIVWLRVLARTGKIPEAPALGHLDLRSLPHLGTLIKDPADRETLRAKG